MRVLVVAPAGEERAEDHCRLVAAAGWEVHLATPEPGARGRAGIACHTPPRPDRWERRWPWLAAATAPSRRRLRLAAARTSYLATDLIARRTGTSLDPGPLALRPPAGEPVDPSRRAVERMLRAGGFAPDPDLAWLAALGDRLRPDVVAAFGVVSAGVLVAAVGALQPASPPRLVVVTDRSAAPPADGLDPIRVALAGAVGVLAESRSALDWAAERGFAGSVAAVVPLSGGWPRNEIAAARAAGPPSRRRTIVVWGGAGEDGRAFVALRAAALAAPALADARVVVVAPSNGGEIAARLLAADCGLAVETVAPGDAGSQLRLLASARCLVSLVPGAEVPPLLPAALAAGALPIVAPSAGLADWLPDGQAALVVPADDPSAVAAALRQAVSNDEPVDRAAAVTAAFADAALAREAVGERVLDAYRRVAAGRAGGDGTGG